jgi:hypothetical protein
MDSNLKCFSKITFDASVVLGKGVFGTVVYDGKLLGTTENKIAVKEVAKNEFIITGQKAIEDHILPLGNKHHHANVVQYFAFEKSQQDYW